MRHINKLPAAAGAGCLAAALIGTSATPALADYGTSAQYQVEISANNVGGVPGDGVWLWIELNRNGSGDYTGADCIHAGPAGLNGAGHERGDVTWADSGGKLTITGVGLAGSQFPVTVVVPDGYGHYHGAPDSFIQNFALGSIGGTRASPGRPVRTAHTTAPAAAPPPPERRECVPVSRAGSRPAIEFRG